MLTINPISYNFRTNFNRNNNNNVGRSFLTQKPDTFTPVAFTANKKYGCRMSDDIEHEQYKKMNELQKETLRETYRKYYFLTDINELYFPKRFKTDALPLDTDEDMKDFLSVAKGYNKYKDNEIICVGRSPKWFLNASIWMKDGIGRYNMACFSSNWYHRNGNGVGPKMFKDPEKMPTLEQELAYRKYIDSLGCDPATLVKKFKETGKPVVITDYIHSGCGLTSYLDLMSRYAKDQGCLEEFANSIMLYTFASMEYLDDLGYDNYYYYPRVMMPELLQPYEKVIHQEYHDLSARVLKSVLIDKNTNECRSTYYPPKAWNIYNPTECLTGMVADEELRKIPRVIDGKINNFTDAMKDYRNLMNFRILDYLYTNDMLKDEHTTI